MFTTTTILLASVAAGLATPTPDHTELVYSISDSKAEARSDLTELIRKRMDAGGMPEVTITLGEDGQSLLVSVPGGDHASALSAKSLLSGPTALALQVVADEKSDPELSAMKKALDSALEKDPELSPGRLAALSIDREDGSRIEWKRTSEAYRASDAPKYMPVLIPADGGFTGRDVAETFVTQDELGFPALGFKIEKDRADAFGNYTEEALDRKLAVIVGDAVLAAPVLQGRISASGQISGGSKGFTPGELKALRTALQSKELPLALTLTSERQVRTG